MFSDIAGVRVALKERLSPALPARWSIEENLKDPPTEYGAPLVTFAFTGFSSTVNGQELGPGQVGAEVDIIVGSPLSVVGKGEDDADHLALRLVQAIDSQADMFWSSAEKQRIESGQWAWRIHTIVLTSSKE